MRIVENTPLERIRLMFSYLSSKYTYEFKFKLGYFADNSCREKNVNVPFAKSGKSLIARLARPFIECLHEAKEAGDINISIDTEKLAESIWSGFENTLMRVKTSKSIEPLNTFQRTVLEALLKK